MRFPQTDPFSVRIHRRGAPECSSSVSSNVCFVNNNTILWCSLSLVSLNSPEATTTPKAHGETTAPASAAGDTKTNNIIIVVFRIEIQYYRAAKKTKHNSNQPAERHPYKLPFPMVGAIASVLFLWSSSFGLLPNYAESQSRNQKHFVCN